MTAERIEDVECGVGVEGVGKGRPSRLPGSGPGA